jgi:signal peptidase II
MSEAGEATQSVRAQTPPETGVAPAERPTWRDPRAWTVLLVVLGLSLAADLVTKSLAFRYVAESPVEITHEKVMAESAHDPRGIGSLIDAHRPRKVVPGLLELTLVLNPGAVFGIGPGQRWFFVVFTGLALGFGVWMFGAWTRRRETISHVAIGMLLGGGLGNLYDRLALGCVRDFLHPLPGLKYPFGWKPLGSAEVWPYVSNVADLLLLIGIALLVIAMWKRDRRRGAARQRPTPATG